MKAAIASQASGSASGSASVSGSGKRYCAMYCIGAISLQASWIVTVGNNPVNGNQCMARPWLLGMKKRKNGNNN